MDTNPLPTQDNEGSDSGSFYEEEESPLVYYVIRVTPHGKFNGIDLNIFLSGEPQLFNYVVGRESVPQEHFHIVAGTDASVTLQDIKDIIRAFIVPFWTDPETHKCPRGFGNKQYNAQVSTDYVKAISYAVKMDQYFYDGHSKEFIEECRAKSFEKKKPSDYKSEYINLCKEFQESDMDVREFMIRFVQLKARYGQMVNVQHAHGYALSNLVKRDPATAEDYVENFLYKL